MTPDRWQRVKAVFGAAIERKDEERAAFVAAACADDPTLVADVQALLASHGKVGGFLAASPALPATEAGPVDIDAPVDPLPKRIGPYELQRELGHGGMGTVYLATRVDQEYQKDVAIKIIR